MSFTWSELLRGDAPLFGPSPVFWHGIADAVFGLTCFGLPLVLLLSAGRAGKLHHKPSFLAFALLLFAAGLAHAAELWLLWQPTSHVLASLKLVMAAASLLGAILLVRTAPGAEVPNLQDMDRARADQASSEARFRAILESAPDAMVIVDSSGRIILTNAQVQSLFGYSSGELLGKAVEVLIPERLRVGHERSRAKYVAEPRVRAMGSGLSLRGVRKDGSEFPVEISLSPFTINGETYISSSIRDVTQRKQIEEERDEFFQLSLDLLCIIDTEGSFKSVNPAFQKTLGFERGELLGKPWLDFVHEEDKEAARSAWLELSHGHATFALEARSRCGDGDYATLEWRATRSATLPVIYATARNVTERKALEVELRSKTKLAEAASVAKGEFLANMSHEIRTPMNGIVGMTELLQATQLTSEQREYAGLIAESCEALLDIINSILDFSKIEAGHLDLDLRSIEVRDSLENIVRSLAPRAHKKGLEVALRVVPQVPARLIGDMGRVRQILLNLLGNAVKFTESGEVTLTVDVSAADEESVCLRFAIRDTGVGIPPEKRQLIFEAFSQVDASMERRFEGTGLGLAISSRLVSLLGGKIWVESQLGRGSTFSFIVPFKREQDTASAADGPLPELRGLSVLIVDDNATSRQVLEEMLRSWAMKVTSVASLEQLEQLGQERISLQDLILFDQGMSRGRVSSLEQLRRRSTKLPPVILMTQTTPERTSEQPVLNTLNYFTTLSKPIKQSKLLDAIGNVIHRRSSGALRASLPITSQMDRPLSVLVAEDNRVNQVFARRLLEAAGHTVTIAANGREALTALEQQKFDLVLMDMQMPEVSGERAVARIRELERRTGAHVPIIAVTAHALKGDAEKYLNLGVDDYVPKPIRRGELLQAIERVCASSASAAASTPAVARALSYDRAAVLRQLEGREEIFGELCQAFRDESSTLLSELRQALAEQDAERLARAAHTLKGAVAVFRAQNAMKLAAELEAAARVGKYEAATLARLEAAVQELIEDLKANV